MNIIPYDFELQKLIKDKRCQMRRIMNPQPPEWIDEFGYTFFTPKGSMSGRGMYNGKYTEKFFKCPFGAVGEDIWCKEVYSTNGFAYGKEGYIYKTDLNELGRIEAENLDEMDIKWRSPVTMPYEASRLTIVSERVWTERVRDITEEGAMAEGVWPEFEMSAEEFSDKKFIPNSTYKLGFKHLWDSHAKPGYKFADNPVVWCGEVRVK